MALSAYTRIGGTNPWPAYSAIQAKSEALPLYGHKLYLSKENSTLRLSKENNSPMLSKEITTIRLTK